jgi:hypothetical protein
MPRVILHKKQGIAYRSKATEILYGGGAGGGKSHLIRIVAIAWCLAVPNIQVYLFRRISDDLIKNHMEGETGFPSMLSKHIEAKQVRLRFSPPSILFDNGAKIHLCHCQYEKDVYKYQGADIQILLIDELTHFTDSIYRYLRGRCRIGGLNVPERYKNNLPKIICGSNPGGIGHNWVKSTFIDIAPPFTITKMAKEDGGMLRQFIPALLVDNPTMTINDPDYIDRLEGLGNEALVKAMRDGDWNIVSGGAFDDVWSNKVIISQFIIPPSWRLDRSFDWGSSHPFAVAWWAQADGSEALVNGVKFCPPRGSIIMIAEWYGASGPNKGIKMSARDIAAGIVQREQELKQNGWISKAVNPGPADNQIINVVESGAPTIATEMASKGIRWTNSDKSSGSRRIGLELIRQRLKEAAKDTPESAGLWIVDNCRATLSQLPVLPRDQKNPEDVDTKAEDHMYDAIRYRVLATKQQASQIKIGGI